MESITAQAAREISQNKDIYRLEKTFRLIEATARMGCTQLRVYEILPDESIQVLKDQGFEVLEVTPEPKENSLNYILKW
jgi:hypothetical protein